MNKLLCLVAMLLVGTDATSKDTTSDGPKQEELVSVASFYGNCKAAVSYTFDDGLQDQYTMAFPEMKRRGLRGTFAINGSKIGGWVKSKSDPAGSKGSPAMTWEMVREMYEADFEIANHGWNHKSLLKIQGKAIDDEIEKNDSAIMVHTGRHPMTFVYPYNAKSDSIVVVAEQGRVGSRTKQKGFGNGDTEQSMNQYVEDIMHKGAWGVVMIHGIAAGYAHFNNPEQLFHHWDYVCSQREDLWVAPFCEVAAYVKERDNVTVKVVSHDAKRTKVQLSLSLDASIYHQSLTLIFNGIAKKVRQDGKKLERSYQNGKTLINGINPSGGEIIITY